VDRAFKILHTIGTGTAKNNSGRKYKEEMNNHE